MTKGEEIKNILGLGQYKYVVFERILRFPVKAITIYYDSHRPNLPLTNDLLHRKFHFVSIRKPPFTHNLPTTPIMPIEFYNSGDDPSLIFVFDIGGDLTDPKNQIPRVVEESIEKPYEPKLDEWVTLKDLNTPDTISAFTKHTRDVRSGYLGGENRTAKLINCVYNPQADHLTFIFKTEATVPAYPKTATFKKANPTLNFSLSNNPDKTYYIHIRILDFMRWLKGTRPDELEGQPISWKEIKDVLDVAYIQLWSSSPSFHWQGMNYNLSQIDGAIYPTDIAPKVWDKIHGDAFLDKHTYGLIRQIGFFGNQMASMANKELKARGYIN